MKPLVFTLLICFLVIQDGFSYKPKQGFIRKKKVDSYRQILDLKKGCLLVMLHHNQNKIDALKSIGREADAALSRDQQIAKNKALIKSFREQFNFCPVYFFMNSQANDLVEKGIDAIIFVDDSLRQDPSIKPCMEKFLLAEFANMQMDTGKYFDGYSLSNADTGEMLRPKYYSTSTYMYQALIIESPQLVQLKRPFPYFVRIIENDQKVYNHEKVIMKLNSRLIRFLGETQEEICKKRFKPYFRDVLIKN